MSDLNIPAPDAPLSDQTSDEKKTPEERLLELLKTAGICVQDEDGKTLCNKWTVEKPEPYIGRQFDIEKFQNYLLDYGLKKTLYTGILYRGLLRFVNAFLVEDSFTDHGDRRAWKKAAGLLYETGELEALINQTKNRNNICLSSGIGSGLQELDEKLGTNIPDRKLQQLSEAATAYWVEFMKHSLRNAEGEPVYNSYSSEEQKKAIDTMDIMARKVLEALDDIAGVPSLKEIMEDEAARSRM